MVCVGEWRTHPQVALHALVKIMTSFVRTNVMQITRIRSPPTRSLDALVAVKHSRSLRLTCDKWTATTPKPMFANKQLASESIEVSVD